MGGILLGKRGQEVDVWLKKQRPPNRHRTYKDNARMELDDLTHTKNPATMQKWWEEHTLRNWLDMPEEISDGERLTH